MLHAIANETVMGRVVCPRRIDPFAAELQLPERLPRGRWALPAPKDRPRTPEPPRPLELGVLHVEPAVAAPGGPLRIRVRLDARVAEEDLVVTIGGAVRPSFRLSDRQSERPAAVVDGAVDGAIPRVPSGNEGVTRMATSCAGNGSRIFTRLGQQGACQGAGRSSHNRGSFFARRV